MVFSRASSLSELLCTFLRILEESCPSARVSSATWFLRSARSKRKSSNRLMDSLLASFYWVYYFTSSIQNDYNSPPKGGSIIALIVKFCSRVFEATFTAFQTFVNIHHFTHAI